MEIVINARVDVYLQSGYPPDRRADEALRRGRLYLGGPRARRASIPGLVDDTEIARRVEDMGGPLNVWLRPNGPPLDALHRIGVARISTASALQHLAASFIADFARSLLAGKTKKRAVERMATVFDPVAIRWWFVCNQFKRHPLRT